MNIRVLFYVTSITLKNIKTHKIRISIRKMKYSNSFDVLQEDDESSIPLEKQLRNKKKRLREIKGLKSKPYDQLNEAQKKKLESEQQIKDETENIEASINEQTKSQTPQQRHVQKKNAKKKRKRKKNVPKIKKTNEMTKEQREAYETHKEKVKQQTQQKTPKKRKIEQERKRQEAEQERRRQEAEQERKRQEAEQERQAYLKRIFNPFTNLAHRFACNNDMSFKDALKKITGAKHIFNIEDLLNIDKRDVRKTYRKLSLKHHPDKGGDTETMKQINYSNEILNELISYN